MNPDYEKRMKEVNSLLAQKMAKKSGCSETLLINLALEFYWDLIFVRKF